MSIPFTELKTTDGKLLRHWDENVDQDELCWHRDHENRIAKITECGDGWKFQFDNELPIDIKKGSILKIKEGQWHRLIKGDGPLSAVIIKL